MLLSRLREVDWSERLKKHFRESIAEYEGIVISLSHINVFSPPSLSLVQALLSGVCSFIDHIPWAQEYQRLIHIVKGSFHAISGRYVPKLDSNCLRFEDVSVLELSHHAKNLGFQ